MRRSTRARRAVPAVSAGRRWYSTNISVTYHKPLDHFGRAALKGISNWRGWTIGIIPDMLARLVRLSTLLPYGYNTLVSEAVLHWKYMDMDVPKLARPQWSAGSRIQLIRPIIGVMSETRGTILRRFTFDSFYDVCFDGYETPRLVDAWNLAPEPVESTE